MQYTALGMIETRGLVGSIEAADAACKAAEVHMLGLEKVTGGLVMIRFVGETASVQAAVDAGSAAAARAGMLVSTRVIPRLDDQAVRMLGLRDPGPGGGPDPGSGPRSEAGPDAGIPEGATVPQLRALARAIPDFPFRGRELNRLSREQLIAELTRIQTQGKGHE